MKGAIQLIVEVDYDKIITKDTIDGLYKFTGVDNGEGLIKYHMDMLSENIAKVVKDLPHTVYQIQGKLIPNEAEKKILEERQKQQQQTQPEPEPEPEPEPNQEPEQSNGEAQNPSDVENVSPIVEKIVEELDNVAMEHGNPQKIKISTKHEYEIVSAKEQDSNDNARKVTISGFDVEFVPMEESFIIEYKTYSDGTVKQLSFKLNR